ncbi:regucalcin [Leptinotarsa decemlineata]|uniref:regucalcin n=1 Tax=Leptinotarsa decemlineata TaxID=7539 RepID=UPI003D308C12
MIGTFLCTFSLWLFTSLNVCAAYTIKPVTPPIQHSEGPHWIENQQMVYYVDTFRPTIYRWEYSTGKVSSHRLDHHDSIGIIIPIKDTEDEFVVGADQDIYRLKWPKEDSNEKIEFVNLAKVQPTKSEKQFNDGKADCHGRIWAGVLTRNEDLTVQPHGGCLYMVTVNGTIEKEEKISNTSISNGLAWTKDSKKFYFIDSTERTVTGYDYDQTSGEIENKTTVFNLADHPDLKGIPDGMIIDDEDNLWVALFGGTSVVHLNPSTGKIIKVITIPATYVTSACFGGPELDVLYVTTSRLHLNETEQLKEPLAGSVFAIEDLGVKGVRGHAAIFNLS